MTLIFFANPCIFWLTHGNKKACKSEIYRLLSVFNVAISGEGGKETTHITHCFSIIYTVLFQPLHESRNDFFWLI